MSTSGRPFQILYRWAWVLSVSSRTLSRNTSPSPCYFANNVFAGTTTKTSTKTWKIDPDTNLTSSPTRRTEWVYFPIMITTCGIVTEKEKKTYSAAISVCPGTYFCSVPKAKDPTCEGNPKNTKDVCSTTPKIDENGHPSVDYVQRERSLIFSVEPCWFEDRLCQSRWLSTSLRWTTRSICKLLHYFEDRRWFSSLLILNGKRAQLLRTVLLGTLEYWYAFSRNLALGVKGVCTFHCFTT